MFAGPYVHLAAQQPQWSEPIQLNTSDGATPAIVVDNAGDVHVFWGSQTDLAPGALFHTRLSRGVWGMPTDVLISPTGDQAQYPSAVVDRAGVIHLVWAGDAIYYSYGWQEDADLVRGWSAPRVLSTGQATTPSIVLDGQGHLHVLYADIYHSPYIRHTASTDGGASWSEPVIVSAPQGDALAINADLAIDQDDVLHAVWAETIEDFPPSGIYYARSEDQGRTWSRPFAVAVGGYSWGSIGVDAENALHLFWTGTAEWAGKYHRLSRDGGLTWGDTVKLWGGSWGLLAFASMLVSPEGELHIIAPAWDQRYGESTSGEILYAAWNGDGWSEPVDVSVGMWTERRENHSPQATFDIDGDMHVVWDMADFSPPSGAMSSYIWYAHLDSGVGSPSAPAAQGATSTPDPSLQGTAPVGQLTVDDKVQDLPPVSAQVEDPGIPGWVPLAAGGVLSGVIIGVVLIVNVGKRRS